MLLLPHTPTITIRQSPRSRNSTNLMKTETLRCSKVKSYRGRHRNRTWQDKGENTAGDEVRGANLRYHSRSWSVWPHSYRLGFGVLASLRRQNTLRRYLRDVYLGKFAHLLPHQLHLTGTLWTMQKEIVPLYSIMSSMGYGLLPMLPLGAVGILFSLRGGVGIVVGLACAAWSSFSAGNFMDVLIKDTKDRKILVIYPLFLFYVSFTMIVIFWLLCPH